MTNLVKKNIGRKRMTKGNKKKQFTPQRMRDDSSDVIEMAPLRKK